MPFISLDCASFAGLAWTFKLQPSKHRLKAHGMLGHMPLNFRDQHMAA